MQRFIAALRHAARRQFATTSTLYVDGAAAAASDNATIKTRSPADGSVLAEHLLTSKPTFTDWAETQGLAGAPLREALTIARALDLATEHQGASYLTSPPAEVLSLIHI